MNTIATSHDPNRLDAGCNKTVDDIENRLLKNDIDDNDTMDTTDRDNEEGEVVECVTDKDRELKVARNDDPLYNLDINAEGQVNADAGVMNDAGKTDAAFKLPPGPNYTDAGRGELCVESWKREISL
jgi:hypothetical protein